MNWPASVISWSSVGVSAPRRRRPGCVDRSLAPMRPSRALQETSHIVFVTSPRNLSREEGIIDNLDISFIRFPNLAISLLYRSRSWDFLYFFRLVILVIPWIIVYFKKTKFKNNTICIYFPKSSISSLLFNNKSFSTLEMQIRILRFIFPNKFTFFYFLI